MRPPKPPPRLWCCGCAKDVTPTLTTGAEVYPHRSDLFAFQFWRCDDCGNWVGCHKGTASPLGNIPTPELRYARGRIHALIDPLWKSRRTTRQALYAEISHRIGKEYHTGDILDIEDARTVYRIGLDIKKGLQ